MRSKQGQRHRKHTRIGSCSVSGNGAGGRLWFFRLLKAAPQNGANKNHLELFGHNCVLIGDEEYAQSKKNRQ